MYGLTGPPGAVDPRKVCLGSNPLCVLPVSELSCEKRVISWNYHAGGGPFVLK